MAIATTVAWAGTDKLSPDLQNGNTSGSVDVIVQYKGIPSKAAHGRLTAKGGMLRHDLSLIKSRHYTVPGGSLAELANDPEVAYVTPDRPLHAHSDQADATIGANAAAT